MLPLNPSSLSNHHRKSFPLVKVFIPTPSPTWKAADELPSDALTSLLVFLFLFATSTKRSHECWVSNDSGIVAEQNHRQPSTSPVRAASPSSSNASVRKKIKQNGGAKFRPPKTTTLKPSSSDVMIRVAKGVLSSNGVGKLIGLGSMPVNGRNIWLMNQMGLIAGDLGMTNCKASELLGFDDYAQCILPGKSCEPKKFLLSLSFSPSSMPSPPTLTKGVIR